MVGAPPDILDNNLVVLVGALECPRSWLGGTAASERAVKCSVIFSHTDAPGLGQRELWYLIAGLNGLIQSPRQDLAHIRTKPLERFMRYFLDWVS